MAKTMQSPPPAATEGPDLDPYQSARMKYLERQDRVLLLHLLRRKGLDGDLRQLADQARRKETRLAKEMDPHKAQVQVLADLEAGDSAPRLPESQEEELAKLLAQWKAGQEERE